MPGLPQIAVILTILCIATAFPGCPDKPSKTLPLREVTIKYQCAGDPDPALGPSGDISISPDGRIFANRTRSPGLPNEPTRGANAVGQLDARTMIAIMDLEKKADLAKLQRNYAAEPTSLNLPFDLYQIENSNRATMVEDHGSGPRDLREYVAGVASVAALWFADDQGQLDDALRSLGTHEMFPKNLVKVEDIESIELRDQFDVAQSIYQIDKDGKLLMITGRAKAKETIAAALDVETRQRLFESVVESRFFDLASHYGHGQRDGRTTRLTIRLRNAEHTVSFGPVGPRRLFELVERIRASIEPALSRPKKQESEPGRVAP